MGAGGLFKPGELQTGTGKGARPVHCIGVEVGAGSLWWPHKGAWSQLLGHYGAFSKFWVGLCPCFCPPPIL